MLLIQMWNYLAGLITQQITQAVGPVIYITESGQMRRQESSKTKQRRKIEREWLYEKSKAALGQRIPNKGWMEERENPQQLNEKAGNIEWTMDMKVNLLLIDEQERKNGKGSWKE